VSLSADAARLREKLASGVPLLRGETLPLDESLFRKRWLRACELLAAQQDDQAAGRLGEAMRKGQLQPAALVGAVLAGEPWRVQQRAEELSLDPTLATTLLRFTLFPLFVALGASLTEVRTGIGWEQGSCPTCGSWPLLGEFRGLDQSRFLRCGLCAAE